jgi:hypothetical protein
MMGLHGRVKLFTSWWLRSKEKERKRTGTKYTLQGHTPSNLLSPSRAHLPLNYESINALIQ